MLFESETLIQVHRFERNSSSSLATVSSHKNRGLLITIRDCFLRSQPTQIWSKTGPIFLLRSLPNVAIDTNHPTRSLEVTDYRPEFLQSEMEELNERHSYPK